MRLSEEPGVTPAALSGIILPVAAKAKPPCAAIGSVSTQSRLSHVSFVMSQTVDYATTVMGHKSRMPVFLAPMASLQLVTPAAAQAVDDAAEEFGILNMLSGHSRPSLEEIAMNSLHPKVYQIYVRGGRDWLEELLGRVKQNNYDALAVTVDAAVYSNRERQMMAGWTPPTRTNSGGREFLAGLSWDTWDEIRQIWGGPMILKGVSRPEDAEIGVQHGASVIYVSNHGGRQLDHDRATIQVLPDIVAAVDGRAEVFVDGGFMRGTDVIKAVALGAQAVGIGKLQAFALCAGGLSGLMDCLTILEDEIRIGMGLLGVSSLDQLDPLTWQKDGRLTRPRDERLPAYSRRSPNLTD